jgi:hypothetical protein
MFVIFAEGTKTHIFPIGSLDSVIHSSDVPAFVSYFLRTFKPLKTQRALTSSPESIDTDNFT